MQPPQCLIFQTDYITPDVKLQPSESQSVCPKGAFTSSLLPLTYYLPKIDPKISE